MTKFDPSQPTSNPPEPTGCLEALVRISWLLLGNIALVFLAFSMVAYKGKIVFDFAYWLTVIGLIGIRMLDIKKFKGETSDNEPATMVHWRKYTIRLILSAAFGYGLAKVLSYLNLF